jgi:GT2 family glycosyltransferase
MNNQPKLSIAFITHNRPIETLALLKSMLKMNEYDQYVLECIIRNNGSTVSYNEVLEFIKEHPELKIDYTYFNENELASKGKSWVMQKAKGEYILVIDDDVEFNNPDDIIKIATLFEKPFHIENNTGIINLDIHYYSTRSRQITAFPHKKYSKYQDKKVFNTSYFVGAAAVFKKKAVEEVGYYRHSIIYMEEYDLSFRVINAGYSIAFDGDVIIWHKETPAGRVPSKAKNAMMWYNKTMIFRNLIPGLYEYTVDFMWSLNFLKNSKFDLKMFFETRKLIRKMRKTIKPEKISKAAMQYLKDVEARLWY